MPRRRGSFRKLVGVPLDNTSVTKVVMQLLGYSNRYNHICTFGKIKIQNSTMAGPGGPMGSTELPLNNK